VHYEPYRDSKKPFHNPHFSGPFNTRERTERKMTSADVGGEECSAPHFPSSIPLQPNKMKSYNASHKIQIFKHKSTYRVKEETRT